MSTSKSQAVKASLLSLLAKKAYTLEQIVWSLKNAQHNEAAVKRGLETLQRSDFIHLDGEAFKLTETGHAYLNTKRTRITSAVSTTASGRTRPKFKEVFQFNSPDERSITGHGVLTTLTTEYALFTLEPLFDWCDFDFTIEQRKGSSVRTGTVRIEAKSTRKAKAEAQELIEALMCEEDLLEPDDERHFLNQIIWEDWQVEGRHSEFRILDVVNLDI